LIVDLTAFDLQFIALFSERQRCVKRALRVKSKKYAKDRGEFELQYLGSMGEFALHKEYDVPLNMDVHVGGDDGIDIVINGWPCHVKTIAFTGPNPHYLMDNMECFTAPVGICCQALSPTKVKILGCIHRKEFAKKSETRDFGYGPRLSLPVESLKPIQVLFDNTPPTDSGEQTREEPA